MDLHRPPDPVASRPVVVNRTGSRFHGSWPVMLTAFRDDLSIDWRGVDALVDWYLEAGSAGLMATCLSSEAQRMSSEEIVQLADRVIRRAGSRVPVVATAMSAGGTPDGLELCRRLHGCGASAVVLLANAFASADEPDGVAADRLQRFADAVAPIPLGLYECPAPYKRLIAPETLGRLARSGRFLWIKETSCSLPVIQQKVKQTAGTPLRIFNANTALMLQAIRAGGAGYSGIAANFFPDLVASACAAAGNDAGGNGAGASGAAGSGVADPTFDTIIRFDQELMEGVYAADYPASAKYCAARFGVPIGTACREARVTLRPETRAAVDRFVPLIESTRLALAG